MQAGLVCERGGQAGLAAVLSLVGLFDTVHTCMAIVEAWLWTVGRMQEVWVQGEGTLDGGVLWCACLVVSDAREGAVAWGRHVGGLQW